MASWPPRVEETRAAARVSATRLRRSGVLPTRSELHRLEVRVHDERSSRGLPHGIEGGVGSDLLQEEPLLHDLDDSLLGHDEMDAAPAGQGQRAVIEDLGASVFRAVLHGD